MSKMRAEKANKLKERLKELVRKDYTQKELSVALGVSYSTVYNWLRELGLKAITETERANYTKQVIEGGIDPKEKCKDCAYSGKIEGMLCCDFILIERHRKKCIPEAGIYESFKKRNGKRHADMYGIQYYK